MSISTRRIFATLLAVITVAAFAHDGHLNDAPWSACNDQHIGDLCAYKNLAKDVYRGTCRAMSDKLICVRNQPIEKADSDAGTSLSDESWMTLRKTG